MCCSWLPLRLIFAFNACWLDRNGAGLAAQGTIDIILKKKAIEWKACHWPSQTNG
jgi:hypothetical protein